MATTTLCTPIIIGVGDIKNRSTALTDAKEPATLMLDAIHAALADASPASVARLQAAIDSIDVVKTWTWPYPDLPRLLARRLAVDENVAWMRYSDHGGNQPAKLFDEAAKRVARGECRVAVVTGGEALASLSAFAAAKELPPKGWTPPSTAVDTVFSPTARDLGNSSVSTLWQTLSSRSSSRSSSSSSTHGAADVGAIHQIGAPIHVYPLYENGFRAHRAQTLPANHAESARLYARFSDVAARNRVAWNYGRSDDEEVIAKVGGRNRMICYPYPLLMNAFNTVNLASALILTSTTFAETLGVPPSKWIYPLGGAGTKDSEEFWQRPNFHSSPSISRSIDASLRVSGITKDDLGLIDIYSCFPIVPKLAAQHLGLPIVGGATPLTLLGGLTSFGGAGNNYSMHALAEMTRQLRAGKAPAGKKGLVLANGGVLSYQHVVILSREPRSDGNPYPLENPLPAQITDVPVPEFVMDPVGEAVVETYTVEFSRTSLPLRAYIIGRLRHAPYARFLANHADAPTLRAMAQGTTEIVGRSGWVHGDPAVKGKSLFKLDLDSISDLAGEPGREHGVKAVL